MAVLNVHRRRLTLPPAEAGLLLDSLSGRADRLWPHDRWPAMRFDGPLAVGARGGHGPIRYRVEAYVPGRWVRFRFTGPRGFHGYHEFCVLDDGPGATVLEHAIVMRLRGPARLVWPLAARWLHDALIEDGLDRADPAARPPRRWSPPVRLLRRLAGDRADRSEAAPYLHPV